MKKILVVPILLLIFLSLACNTLDFVLDGLKIRDDEKLATLDAVETEEAAPTPVEATPEPAEAASEPEYQSVIIPSSDMEKVVAGSHEYSVSATNFDCTCQATDNMTVDFNFTGNQVEITQGGDATMVYDKITENKYQRSVMEQSIIIGEGGEETKEEQERITVIILTSNGYVMENYTGSSSSPCCYYTFTMEK
ncbi:MAG: hypothetical protein R6U51_05005 [Anaerolineales bacterium]